ncbi:ATP-dependent DNA helicase RecG [Sphingomonas sp. Sph1(2015)]|jgi:ATP-dependent DNA helicase RecG|uniref:ATP-dependent DNA helicase RecG n=1 Tax=Sphingomonas sp. Sph1(2015) TaxID=1628084 RepID=UPI0009789EC8|nr:ATP-dependent DNA helicase RecG [Sphingomonas sp. Sph1(2015)]OMJ31422.1 ATP-dependent DNA helicase RecG [Sphingomonas sp. Sph1(2015)]
MRPDILNPLFAEVTSLKGVGPGLAKPLERLRIARVVDVAFHLPTGHIDRFPRDELMMSDAGRVISISLTVKEHRVSSSPRGPTRVRAEDAAGNSVALVYFGGNSGWVKKLLPIGETKVVSGRLDLYGQDLQIVHPDLGDSTEDFREREAIYPLSEGITSRRLGALAVQAVERAPELPEWIEPGLKAQRGWPDWREALARVHADPADAKARERLGYDEVFANQLAMTLVRADTRKRRGRALNGDGRLRDMLKLPYTLTGAQSRTVREIEGDLTQDAPMLRLLQGDVGAGKTLVAAMAMLIAVEAGAQAAMLAPTEILARQHYETLRKTLAGLPLEIAVLTGRDKGKAREATLMALAAGEIDILVGTHAIFQETVTYRDLALVVVDEQHRFGVAQRMMLSAKGKAPPHLLAMTATPIPRTLTLANYGEMDVSRLDEMPPGRQPIETRVVSEDRLDEVVNALGRHLSDGGQAYWVCPLVEESEKSDLAAAEMRAETLRARFGERVGLVHGKMKPAEKDAVMEAFAGGRLGLLVATTVIEVGVDVPNATLIVIEHADRFGLAQLHQLRGRVGRGGGLSRCLLLRGSHLSETSRARLALMRETNDGFRIAEEDLRLRKAGDLLGTRQSGDMVFRLATPETMNDLMQCAQDDARLLIDRDGGLEAPRGAAARTALYLFERDAGVALLRSG